MIRLLFITLLRYSKYNKMVIGLCVDSVGGFFHDCLVDLNANRSNLTNSQYKWALETIRGLQLLSDNMDHISEILDETERNTAITKLTNLLAEPGLIPGNDSQTIRQSILARVDVIRKAYLFDLNKNETFLLYQKNETFLLYQEGFIGPPCFNGRVITLQHYVYARQGIKTDLFWEFSTDVDKEAIELEDIMYGCASTEADQNEGVPTLRDIAIFLDAHPEVKNSLSFTIDHPQIQAIYDRACQFFVR